MSVEVLFTTIQLHSSSVQVSVVNTAKHGITLGSSLRLIERVKGVHPAVIKLVVGQNGNTKTDRTYFKDNWDTFPL